MLLFNAFINSHDQTYIVISKHLMLLFNKKDRYHETDCIKFQNISCYCLTQSCDLYCCRKTFQNISCYCLTKTVAKTTEKTTAFQNISCYCLTIDGIFGSDETTRFQNISCYCLTISQNLIILYFFLFQNISCYCLTKRGILVGRQGNAFQNISCYCLTLHHHRIPLFQSHFKTSHVTV